MPRSPEQSSRPEVPRFPFFLAARFDSRETSQAPYDTIQTIVREQAVADFSVFRILQNWPDHLSKAPPSQKRWYVAVLGNPPPEPPYQVQLYVAANIKTSNAFLRDILAIFGVKTERSYSASLRNLEQFLLEQANAGKIPVLLVDEAQNLTKDMLKLIHYLLNYETDKVKLLQVVLVGQEELGTKIMQFRELASRMFPIAMNTMILDDMREMITFRLHVAGYHAAIIDASQAEEAYQTLYAYTKGLPRDTVRVCSLLLITLAIQRLKQASVEMIVQAAKDSNLFI